MRQHRDPVAAAKESQAWLDMAKRWVRLADRRKEELAIAKMMLDVALSLRSEGK